MALLSQFSGPTWLLLLLIGGSCVLAMLHGMAAVVRSHAQVHEMRRKVARLRRRYAAELAGQQEDEPGEVDIIEVDQEPAPTRAAA